MPAVEVAPVQLPLNQAVTPGSTVTTITVPEASILAPGEISPEPIFEPLPIVGEVPLDVAPIEMSPIVVAPEVYLDTEDPDANSPVWLRNLSLNAGIQGFHGPGDLGRAANFGFHEGANWGFPLLPFWDIAGQLGVLGVHSNFSGNQSRFDPDGFHSARDQLFVTAGFFTRAVNGGWQSGSAFDYFHDSAYSNTDLTQARVELAYNFYGRFEMGFWGAYGANSDTVTFTLAQRLITKVEPTDLYALFYRHHFTGGGQGRLWGGMTGDGAAVFGGEATVPLGTHWSIHNNFTYRVAKSSEPVTDGSDESWAVSIGLIWYPARLSRNVYRDPNHPLFDVADNSVFLINRGPTTTSP